ncbi:MAG: toxin-antitoxin system YwqK family antitoxin [Lutibacter sp.]|nr:toxin-antitoxin system YwqK family antitoxin [Lutibacter sp.]
MMPFIKKLSIKSLLFFLILFVSGTAIAQEKINQLDAQGRRTGVWKKYYDNKNIRYEGQFVAGKEIGVFNYYGELNSEHPIIIKTFSEDNDSAKVSYFYEDGKLESEGSMSGINRIGKWIYYNTDGKTIVSEENYENGLLNGIVTTYFSAGKMAETAMYKDGKLHGNVLRYSSEGILLDDLQYENGKLHGPAKYYNMAGKLVRKGNYENDQKVGNWEYFENGEPISAKKIKG